MDMIHIRIEQARIRMRHLKAKKKNRQLLPYLRLPPASVTVNPNAAAGPSSPPMMHFSLTPVPLPLEQHITAVESIVSTSLPP